MVSWERNRHLKNPCHTHKKSFAYHNLVFNEAIAVLCFQNENRHKIQANSDTEYTVEPLKKYTKLNVSRREGALILPNIPDHAVMPLSRFCPHSIKCTQSSARTCPVSNEGNRTSPSFPSLKVLPEQVQEIFSGLTY